MRSLIARRLFQREVFAQDEKYIGILLPPSVGAVVVIVANIATALSTLLYEVSPLDPGSIVAVAALLATVGICASVLPALRATGVDPASTLRRD